ncbi:hypothetical protein ACIBI0_38650 [Microbispora rosea]|uniref:hypothetical protein n=1 Tax=Microbispora rosea TaxID=58117 RepID=UPI0037A9C5DF
MTMKFEDEVWSALNRLADATSTDQPQEGTTMTLTTAQRAVLVEMMSRQAVNGQATTMTRTHAGVPAWWTNNGHSIRQDELTALNFHGLAGCANEPSPVKHIWRVNVEEAQAALQATQTPTDQPPAQHLPRRGDAVERWLEATRDLTGAGPGWVRVLNQVLEDYRHRADAGVALDADLEG